MFYKQRLCISRCATHWVRPWAVVNAHLYWWRGTEDKNEKNITFWWAQLLLDSLFGTFIWHWPMWHLTSSSLVTIGSMTRGCLRTYHTIFLMQMVIKTLGVDFKNNCNPTYVLKVIGKGPHLSDWGRWKQWSIFNNLLINFFEKKMGPGYVKDNWVTPFATLTLKISIFGAPMP